MDKELFIKRSKIVKSSTFEMVPVGNTREHLYANKVIKADEMLKEYAADAKQVGDAFYRDFIQYFGENAKYDWQSIKQLYDDRKIDGATYTSAKDAMAAKIAKDATKSLREYIVEYSKFVEGDVPADCKPNSSGFVDAILYTYAGKETDKGFDSVKMQEKIAALKGTTSTTFKKYFVGWDKIVATSGYGSIAARIIENFEIYCANMKQFETFAEMFPEDACNFEKSMPNFSMLTDISSYNRCISQSGITEYNMLLGGIYSEDGKRLVDGINMIINENRQKNNGISIRTLSKLKKQILSVDAPLFKIDAIGSLDELKTTLREAILIESRNTERIRKLFAKMHEYRLDNVYIAGNRLNQFSNDITGEWDSIRNIVLAEKKDDALAKKRNTSGKNTSKLTQKEEKSIEENLVKTDYAVTYIDTILRILEEEKSVESWSINEVNALCGKVVALRNALDKNSFWNSDKKPQDASVDCIRQYLDAINDVIRMIKMFVVKDEELEEDYVFYETLMEILTDTAQLTKIYNMVRNYLTKKIKSDVQRTQLCFGRAAHFEQKWQNKDQKHNKLQNVDAALLEKDGVYYYIVPSERQRKIKLFIAEEPYEGSNYGYLTTRKAPELVKVVPRLTFKSEEAKAQYATGVDTPFAISVGEGSMLVSKEMQENYDAGTFKESKEELIKLIDYYKRFITLHPSFSPYDFSGLRPSEEYKNLGEFCKEVDSITFYVKKRYMDAELVDKAVECGELYMFRIQNQDMYKEEERAKDVTSLSFRSIMECMNTGKADIIINNAPTIYYRPAVIDAVDVHPIGSVLVNKRTIDGDYIPDSIYLELCAYFNEKKEMLSAAARYYKDKVTVKQSDRPHIKDAHYAREMFTITISYTLNKDVMSESSAYALGEKVRDHIRKHGTNVLTVIRGTNHLLYYMVVDMNMNILEMGDLNVVGDTDFYKKLTVLDQERKNDQKNWKYEKTVATLKDTYLEMVTSKIVKLALKYDAIISIDRLFENAKNRASAFDNNVYKKFEIKLVNKLSCYMDASIPKTEPGGILNPLQLATKDCASYQNGILFYTTAAHTKNVCFKTGFVNLLNTYNIKSVTPRRAFLDALDRIWYDKQKNVFSFTFRYSQVGCILQPDEAKKYNGMDREWTVSTHMERMRRDPKTRVYKEISGTEELIAYFNKNNIDYMSKDIDVTSLDAAGVNLLFDVFVIYVNGYYPMVDNMKDSVYYSPVSDWNSMGKMPYDALTAYNLAEKSVLTMWRINDMIEEDKKTNAYVERVDWLNYLLARAN